MGIGLVSFSANRLANIFQSRNSETFHRNDNIGQANGKMELHHFVKQHSVGTVEPLNGCEDPDFDNNRLILASHY